jgi:hypothetical protein
MMDRGKLGQRAVRGPVCYGEKEEEVECLDSVATGEGLEVAASCSATEGPSEA